MAYLDPWTGVTVPVTNLRVFRGMDDKSTVIPHNHTEAGNLGVVLTIRTTMDSPLCRTHLHVTLLGTEQAIGC